MNGERKAIRDSVKAALQPVYAGEIITSRWVDARERQEFVTVFFQSAESAYDGMQLSTTATLVVGYSRRDCISDDELDEVADTLHAGLDAADIAPGVIHGIIPAGFEYGEEQEQAFDSIYLLYTVTY